MTTSQLEKIAAREIVRLIRGVREHAVERMRQRVLDELYRMSRGASGNPEAERVYRVAASAVRELVFDEVFFEADR